MSAEIGSYLKGAREDLGFTLEQVQEMTKIQKSFLVAIEKGEFQKLPSPFYVRTYLRSYANCVKIEPHHILRQYRKEEQAERGLTGAHKIIDEVSIVAASVPQDTGTRDRISGNMRGRVTTNMALTIASPRNSVASEEQPVYRERNNKEIARRNVGYQGAKRPSTTTDQVSTSFYEANSPITRVGESSRGSGQEISVWGSSEDPGVREVFYPTRQADPKQTTPGKSGFFPVPKRGERRGRIRSGAKRRRAKSSQFNFVVKWVFVISSVCVFVVLLYKIFL